MTAKVVKFRDADAAQRPAANTGLSLWGAASAGPEGNARAALGQLVVPGKPLFRKRFPQTPSRKL